MIDRIIRFINGDVRRATLWHCLLIAVVGFLAYGNTFSVPLQLDDLRVIGQNQHVRTFSVPWGESRAVGLWSLALNYRLHGTEVAGYHLLNLAIHIGTALLVYALVLNFGGTGPRFIAFFTALIFVAHPVQTQAVTYIVQRFASLATFFFVGAIVCYGKARLGKDWRRVLWYLAGLVSAVLAMKTKEIAFTLPVVIALYELMFFRGGVVRRIVALTPYLLTMLIIPLSFVSIGSRVPAAQVLDQARQATSVQTVLSRADYLFTQFRVIATYLRLLVFPVNQNLDYDYPVYHSFFAPPVFLSFLMLLALLAIALFLLFCHSSFTNHNSRLIAFGLLWFFVTLSVESSVIPIVDVIFEHRVYLPSVGAILAFVSAVALVAERRKLMVPLFAGLFIVVLVFAGAAFRRNLVWGDEVRLWSDVTTKSPNLSRAWNNLGYALLNSEQPQRALPALVRSIDLKSGFADAHLNIELALRRMGVDAGRIASSEGMVDARGNVDVRRLRRWGGGSFNNLGLAYENMGRLTEARAAYEKALRFDPELAVARENLKAVNDPTIHGPKGER